MNIDRKYYKTESIHRTLPQNANDVANSNISCGFIHKTGKQCVEKNLSLPYYGGLYVISGRGVYVDANNGQRYEIVPGSILQRTPGKVHHTFIEKDSDWLEFYFCGPCDMFNTLVSMKLITDEPVFYVGERMELFNTLLDYKEKAEHTIDYYLTDMLMEFQQLLIHINSLRGPARKKDWTKDISKILKEYCRVGDSLEAVAKKCGMSYELLRKQFRNVFGCSLSQYKIQLRINESKTMLLDKEMPIKEVAQVLGYCDSYAFSNQFKKMVGVTPGKFIADWKK